VVRCAFAFAVVRARVVVVTSPWHGAMGWGGASAFVDISGSCYFSLTVAFFKTQAPFLTHLTLDTSTIEVQAINTTHKHQTEPSTPPQPWAL
jgi:hypothetical protein